MVYPHNSNIVNRTEVGTRSIDVMCLTMLPFGGIWKTLGLCSRKVAEAVNQVVMNHPSRSMENSSAQGDVGYASLA